MTQLGLWEHAPRFHHEALRCLGRLDFPGCRGALVEHSRYFPGGSDPEPVAAAAAWLEARLPGPGEAPKEIGRKLLDLCRALREDVAVPDVLRRPGSTGREALRSAAARAMGEVRRGGATPEELIPGPEGLPWGVFSLWTGGLAAARRHLLGRLEGLGPTAEACLALGDAAWEAGRGEDARCAYREGYALDPAGGGWAPADPEMAALRARAEAAPGFSGAWWAVGAYLEGLFPAYPEAPPALVARRWRRFAVRRQGWLPLRLSDPPLFFAGLFLSEQGGRLPGENLRAVRETLAVLHADGYAWHREQLEERGSSSPGARGPYFAW